MSVLAAVVIVARPADAGKRLCDRLIERGHRAVWWPAFDIEAAPDMAAARAALARLSDHDLAIFVSPNAVRSVKSLLNDAWPANTLIGAVGASTRAAIETELQPGDAAMLIGPDEDDESGSEAFWRAWLASGRSAQRVLLLRAEDGRNWLSERFVESGAEVDAIAVYSRRPHRLSAGDLAQLGEWVTAGEHPTTVFSSSEAIATLDQQVGAGARAWLRTGTAIASHARIAHGLKTAGYTRVVNATFDDDSVIATLESIGSSP